MRASRSLASAAAAVAALALAGPAGAAFPGANGEIAFTSTQDGQTRHIFVFGQGALTDLTGATSTASESQPEFSPDGRQIVYTRGDPGHLPNNEIFVMWADGSHRTWLTNTPQGNSDPTWSPDGRQVAFVSLRSGQVPDIYVMRSDGSDVRQITHDTASESQLAWSPRGDRIAFVRVPPGGGDRDIWSIAPDGSGATDLTNDPTNNDVDPAWAPDGSRIVYTGPGRRGESVGADLWVMNADGSGQVPLHHETNGYSDAGWPAWSPDGSTIAFGANNGSGYFHLWSVPASGGENTELVTNKISGGNPLDWETDWQPLGVRARQARTTITRVRPGRRQAVVSFTAAGTAPRYACSLTPAGRKARFHACRSPQAYKGLHPGRYVFAVRALEPGAAAGPTARRTVQVPGT